jgi:hypothetical protein
MQWLNFHNKPLMVSLLQIVCLSLTILWILVAIRAWENPKYSMGTQVNLSLLQLFYALIWMIITVGIWRLQIWGWALLLGTGVFTFLITVNLLLTRPIGGKMLVVGAAFVGCIFMVILNLAVVRTAFKVDLFNGKVMPSHLRTFAIFCATLGASLFFELLTGSRLAPAAAPSQMFIGSFGLVFIILGIGIWRTNKIALQAPEPLLLFALLAVGFIYAKDFLEATGYFPIRKSLFHLAIIAGLLIYWLVYLRPKISRTINHLMPKNG